MLEQHDTCENNFFNEILLQRVSTINQTQHNTLKKTYKNNMKKKTTKNEKIKNRHRMTATLF